MAAQLALQEVVNLAPGSGEAVVRGPEVMACPAA